MHVMHNNQAKGFSLVELMVVVAIIGILAAVAIPAYFNHVMRVRQGEAFENLLDMRAAQEMYYSMYNHYATSSTDADYQPLLSFDLADTLFYKYSIIGTTTVKFKARADGNNAHLKNDCWEIADNESEPSQPPGCKPDGFSFSLF